MKLTPDQIAKALPALPGWSVTPVEGSDVLAKVFSFADFHQTMTFVNAVATLANQLNHHPDLLVSYGRCRVQWQTHDEQALTELDLRAAALTQALVP